MKGYIGWLLTCLFWIYGAKAAAQKQKLHLQAGLLHYALLEYNKAIEQFHIATTHRKTAGKAHFFLGRMATLGEGQKANQSLAIRHFVQGMSYGEYLNHLGLALAYKYGEGVHRNQDSANFYLSQVPFLNSKTPQLSDVWERLMYAICQYHGHGIPLRPTEAYKLFHQLLAEQIWIAGYYLATCHYEGSLGRTNPDSALYYWQILAQKKHPPSMKNLANAYLYGLGTNVDSVRAATLWQEIFMLTDDTLAGLQAARIFKNYPSFQSTAFETLHKLAVKGHGEAACELGHLYFHGKGVRKNVAEATKWYEQAAKTYQPEAMYALANIYEDGMGVAVDYTKALTWYRQAGYMGFAPAMYRAGYMCEMGKGTKSDYCEAVMWYEKAAHQHHAQALFRLGLCTLYDGRCTSINPGLAISYFERAAGLNEPSAALNLALMYIHGMQVPKDDQLGSFWLRETLKMSPDNPTALFQIGKLGFTSKTTQISPHEALLYLNKAGESGNPEAYGLLAQIYTDGIRVNKNHLTALKYLQKMPISPKKFMQMAQLYEAGGVNLKSDMDMAFIHYFQAFAVADDSTLSANILKKMKIMAKSVNTERVQQLAVASPDAFGLGLTQNEAAELMHLLKKQGILKRR